MIGPNGATADRTVQLEGVVDEPSGPDLERLLALYFARFPDVDPPEIVEWMAGELPGCLFIR